MRRRFFTKGRLTVLSLPIVVLVQFWILNSLFPLPRVGGQITVPNTFVNGTVADAPQVNANFNALASNALNRTGGTMTGTLNARDVIPTADNTYALGSAALKWKLPFIAGGSAGQFLMTDGAGTTSWGSPATLGSCGVRLTLTSGTPVTTADVTAATSVYVSPIAGGQCALYDGSSAWALLTASEVTVPVPATTSTMYDVFCYNNSGAFACDAAAAWTNDTTRATALALQNNVYVKSGTTTRRFIGSFRTTTVSGQTEDSLTKRFVWSYYNRAPRRVRVAETGSTAWTYNTTAWRQVNANAANQVAIVVGVVEAPVSLTHIGLIANGASNVNCGIGIGYDSTTVPDADTVGGVTQINTNATPFPQTAILLKIPTAGYHFYAMLEYTTNAAGATSFYSFNNFVSPSSQGGLIGLVFG